MLSVSRAMASIGGNAQRSLGCGDVLRNGFQRLLRALSALGVLVALATPTLAAEVGFSGMHVQGMNAAIAEALGLKTPDGVLVRDVALGGPADEAGVQRGDLILHFDGVKIDSFKRLVGAVTKTKPEQVVSLTVQRPEGEKVLKLKLGRKPPAWSVDKGSVIAFTEIGLTLASVTEKIRKRFNIRWGSLGVLVTLIDPTFADRMLLQRGDMIVQVNQKPVWTPEQVREHYDAAKKAARGQLLVLVERVGGFEFMMLPVK
jgi:serine protease Do